MFNLFCNFLRNKNSVFFFSFITVLVFLMEFSLLAQESNQKLEYKIYFSSKEIGTEIILFDIPILKTEKTSNLKTEKYGFIDFKNIAQSKVTLKDPDTNETHNLKYIFNNSKLSIIQDDTTDERVVDKIFPIEPPITLFLYKILSLNSEKIEVFLPSTQNIFNAIMQNSGVQKVFFRKKEIFLKKHFLVFDQTGVEIFTDMDGKIVLTNSPNLSLRTEYIGDSIKPYSDLKELLPPSKILKKTDKIIVNSIEFPINIYSPKKTRSLTNILLIHDFNDETNHFYEKLASILGEKCGNIIFPIVDVEKLKSFNDKYEIYKKVLKKYKNIHIISLGEGSIISYRLKKEFKNKIKSITLLNPLYFNYFEILTQQADFSALQENRKIALKTALKEFDKVVKSDEKQTIFNNKKISTKYFSELFKEDAKNYIDILKGDIAIFTGKYDSDFETKNGWYLYSFIEKNSDTKVIYKEIDESNHHFFKVPYKSYAFDFQNEGEINKIFIKELTKFLRKVTK